jgi:hypothetical protein
MERWLLIAFQVGHVSRSLGETLLTLHEVMTYGSFNGRSALPEGRQATATDDDHRAPRETRKGSESSSEREDADNQVEARSDVRGHPGGNQADEQQPQEEVKGNGEVVEPEAIESLLEGQTGMVT